MKRLLVLSASLGLLAGTASAGDLTYTPVNPSFGGNPLNSAHLLGLANAQRQATASDANKGRSTGTGGTGTDTSRNNAALFVRQLEGRLLSALAGQVTEAIFGDTPQDSGDVTFGTTTVSFERTLETIRLVIIDNLDGTVTEIVVPQLVSGGT